MTEIAKRFRFYYSQLSFSSSPSLLQPLISLQTTWASPLLLLSPNLSILPPSPAALCISFSCFQAPSLRPHSPVSDVCFHLWGNCTRTTMNWWRTIAVLDLHWTFDLALNCQRLELLLLYLVACLSTLFFGVCCIIALFLPFETCRCRTPTSLQLCEIPTHSCSIVTLSFNEYEIMYKTDLRIIFIGVKSKII